MRALAILRAAEVRLRAGLGTRDLCGASFAPAKFTAGVVIGDGATPAPQAAAPKRLAVRSVRVAAARVRLDRRAVVTNHRLATLALAKANAIARRLDGRLTGRDLRAGAITAGKLAPGTAVLTASGRAGSAVPFRVRPRQARRVRVAVGRMRADHRAARTALVRAVAIQRVLERGVSGARFRNRSIPGARLAESLRPGGGGT
jgi:hypothetical protein